MYGPISQIRKECLRETLTFLRSPRRLTELKLKSRTSGKENWPSSDDTLSLVTWLCMSSSVQTESVSSYACCCYIKPAAFQLLGFPRNFLASSAYLEDSGPISQGGGCTYLKRKWSPFWHLCRIASSFSP